MLDIIKALPLLHSETGTNIIIPQNCYPTMHCDGTGEQPYITDSNIGLHIQSGLGTSYYLVH